MFQLISSQAFCLIFLNALFLQEEFLRDVMQFLILRGHTRLVPQGGLAEFPDAILNAKRLDLFNLYREVSLVNLLNMIRIAKEVKSDS